MATTTRATGFAQEVNVWLADIVRRIDNGPLVASYFMENADMVTLPRGAGTGTARFIRPAILGKGRTTSIDSASRTAQIQVTQVARGSNPTPETWNKAHVDMTLKRIGNVVAWDDQLGYESPLIVNPAPLMNEIVRQYMNYMDSMALDALTKRQAGTGEAGNVQTNVSYADPGNNTNVTTITTAAADTITKAALDAILQGFRTRGIPPKLTPVMATQNIGTRPVPAAFAVLTTEQGLSDIIAAAGTNWIPAASYNSLQLGDYWPEAGAYYNNGSYALRVFASNNGPELVNAGASNAEVTASIFVGKGAGGKVKSGENFELVVVTTPDSGNRLGLIESLGWKSLETMGILQAENTAIHYSRG